ncbi:MAG: hypothetical protein OEM94_02220 [Acidimicrobiia bacterium]|nr:hypothetical protein [Acidimicrobiia bacterium]
MPLSRSAARRVNRKDAQRMRSGNCVEAEDAASGDDLVVEVGDVCWSAVS